jgi:hypothetical protein
MNRTLTVPTRPLLTLHPPPLPGAMLLGGSLATSLRLPDDTTARPMRPLRPLYTLAHTPFIPWHTHPFIPWHTHPLYLGTHTLYTLAHTPLYLGTHTLYTLARPSTTLPTHPPPGSLHDVPPAHPLDRHGGLLYRRAQHPREEERQRRALPTRPLTLTPTPAYPVHPGPYPVHALAAPATCGCSPCDMRSQPLPTCDTRLRPHATRACSPMRHAVAGRARGQKVVVQRPRGRRE